LKTDALKNIPCIVVTADVSQLLIGWSKADALLNMKLISVTADVVQPPIS
jgi:hypothetical protein